MSDTCPGAARRRAGGTSSYAETAELAVDERRTAFGVVNGLGWLFPLAVAFTRRIPDVLRALRGLRVNEVSPLYLTAPGGGLESAVRRHCQRIRLVKEVPDARIAV